MLLQLYEWEGHFHVFEKLIKFTHALIVPETMHDTAWSHEIIFTSNSSGILQLQYTLSLSTLRTEQSTDGDFNCCIVKVIM